MECLQLETTSTLMSETQKAPNKKENLYIRFLRKKYKCILMWLLSIIAISQLFIIIFEKVDGNILLKLTNYMLDHKNYTNSTSPNAK